MYITLLLSDFEPFQFINTKEDKKSIIKRLDERFLVNTYLVVAIINEILKYKKSYTFDKLYDIASDKINNTSLNNEIEEINNDYELVLEILEDKKLESIVNKYGYRKSIF